MSGRAGIEVSSRLEATSEQVWARIATADGVNDETDSVSWEPRLPVPAAAMRPLFRAIFGHRHRRLRRRFGGVPAEAGES